MSWTYAGRDPCGQKLLARNRRARYHPDMTPARALATILLIVAALPASGCHCWRCERERERTLIGWGEPEERTVERSGHFFTETWFYWDSRRTVVFLWDDRECTCSVDTYVFDEGGVTQTLGFRTASPYPLRP